MNYLGINPQDRPEQLSVETYIELGNHIVQRRVIHNAGFEIPSRGRCRSNFIEGQSNPAEGRDLSLHTQLKSLWNITAQLPHRYWSITDGEGAVREVHGDGVVGEQPTIVPGDEFTYTSGAISKQQ